jgi:signal transduction histidine kinase
MRGRAAVTVRTPDLEVLMQEEAASSPGNRDGRVRSEGAARTRIAVIAALTLALTAAHYLTSLDVPLAHDVMDRLYYVPIALAALWYGSRGSFAVGSVAMVLYVPHVIQFELYGGHAGHAAYGNKYAEAVLFPVFGLFVGRLIDVIRARNAEVARTYRELLESQRASERSARLALVGQIASGLAHEIRNPLAGLRGSVEALADQIPKGNEVARDFVTRSLAEIERIGALVSDFVAFGRPSSVERSPVRLVELVRGVAALLSSQARKGGVRIEVGGDDGGAEAMLDGSKIKQALLNLMLNGIEAMPEGGTLSVTVERAGDEVALTVHDEGPGVTAEDPEEVFSPFFTTKDRGAGLGLSMARQIAESHGGSLRIERGGRPGATFVMRLPAGGPEEAL